jgi:uncharacterized membrane protein (UPF0127 family)
MNIDFGDVVVDADHASTPEELHIGLSETDSLGENEGMLFQWPMQGQHGLIMRDMSFPIDTVFLSPMGEVVHTATLERDGAQVAAFCKYALEVPAGFCDRYGIEVGDTTSFDIQSHNVSKQETGDGPNLTEKLHRTAVSALESTLRTRTVSDMAKQASQAVDETPSEQSTPSGVPENSEYVPPDYEPEEGEQVIVSDYGGNYVVSPSESQTEETEVTGEELTDFAMSQIEFGEVTSLVSEHSEPREEIIGEMTDAVAAGLNPDVAVESVRSAIERQSSWSEIYSPEEVMGRFASRNYPADTEAGERLNQQMYMLGENPEEFPDVTYGHGDDPFENDAPELEAELKDRITPDNVFDMTRSGHGIDETVGVLGEAVEDGVDPVDAVMALAAAYDDSHLEVMDPADVASRISLRDVEPETPAEAEVTQAFRRFRQDPENYPRDLSDTEEGVLGLLESVVDEEKVRAYSVNELTWSSIQYNNTEFSDEVADIVRDGGDVQEVTGTIEKYVDGRNRGLFYTRLSSKLGARETALGDTKYLMGYDGFEQANEILDGKQSREERREWSRVRTQWFLEVYGEKTAPLFQIAEEETGNSQVPSGDGVFDVFDAPPNPDQEIYEEVAEHSRDIIKEVYGDTITCYRGLSPEGNPSGAGSTDISQMILQAVEDGESFEFPHRTLESWSVDPIHARLFSGANDDEEDGVIIEAEIDTDRVIAASGSGALSAKEEELVIAHDESRMYEPEQVITADELRNGKDAALLLENTREFLQRQMTDEQEKSKSARTIDVSIDDLPPLNWLRLIDIERSPREKMLKQAVSVVEEQTPSGVPDNSEYVPPDYEPKSGEQIVVSDYGGNYVVSDEPAQQQRPDWFEEDVASYGQLEQTPSEGDYIKLGGRIHGIDRREGDTVTTTAAFRWAEGQDYTFQDGVATTERTRSLFEPEIQDDETVYIEMPDDSELNDGWYKTRNTSINTEDMVEVESTTGDSAVIERTLPEKIYTPASSERLTHSMGTPWEKYDSQEFPTDTRLDDTVPLESLKNINDLSGPQIDAVSAALAKADEWEMLDDLKTVAASDNIPAVAAYMPGPQKMVFNPERFTREHIQSIQEDYVTKGLRDTVLHEAMHAMHMDSLKKDSDYKFEETVMGMMKKGLYVGEKALLRELVSDYSTTNALEAVAEIGTKILKGEEVRDEALYVYERCLGPEL